MLRQKLAKCEGFKLHEAAVAAETETRRMYMLDDYHSNPVQRGLQDRFSTDWI